MANVKLTEKQKFLLNRLSMKAQVSVLGDLLDGKVAGAISGCILISGGFVTESTHVDPETLYGNLDDDDAAIFTVTADTQAGGYKIQLADAYVGYQVIGITGSVGKGVAYNAGSPDLSGTGSLYKLDAPCINSGTGEIFIVTQAFADSTPDHAAGEVVSFLIVLKPE